MNIVDTKLNVDIDGNIKIEILPNYDLNIIQVIDDAKKSYNDCVILLKIINDVNYSQYHKMIYEFCMMNYDSKNIFENIILLIMNLKQIGTIYDQNRVDEYIKVLYLFYIKYSAQTYIGSHMINLYDIANRMFTIPEYYVAYNIYDYIKDDTTISSKKITLYMLGLMNERGLGTTINKELAFKYFQESAKYDYSQAYNYLGYMYNGGHGCKIDYQKALENYEIAVSKGDLTAPKNINTLAKRLLISNTNKSNRIKELRNNITAKDDIIKELQDKLSSI